MRILAAAFALCLVAGLASAQGLTATDWTGTYGGVTLGLANGESAHLNNGADTGGPGISGGAFGLTLGHNFAPGAGDVVYGVEGDVSATDISGDQAIGFHNGFNCVPGPCRTSLTWLATLRGRVGITRGNMLIYGTAGLAAGGVEASIPGAAFLDIGTQAETGWTAGVGAEFQINERTSLKADVIYVDLGRTRYDDGALPAANGFYVDTSFTQLRLGMNFRF